MWINSIRAYLLFTTFYSVVDFWFTNSTCVLIALCYMYTTGFTTGCWSTCSWSHTSGLVEHLSGLQFAATTTQLSLPSPANLTSSHGPTEVSELKPQPYLLYEALVWIVITACDLYIFRLTCVCVLVVYCGTVVYTVASPPWATITSADISSTHGISIFLLRSGEKHTAIH